ncbi:MAG: GntR family transcriptional regulator, partial [Desulfobacterales bacterium]
MKTTTHMPYIYAVLFDGIISGEYPPNTRLKEEELAQQFDVSRTPIRVTLRQLEQDGLVEILPKRGARVVGFTVDDVEEVYDIRKSLEIQALKTSVPHLNIQGLLEIRAKLKEISNISDQKVHEEFDARVHNYFIQASGKRRLISILNQMFRLIQRFRELGFEDPDLRVSACEAHLALIDAICLRDVNKAVEILADHIEQSKLNAVSYIVKKSGASGWKKKT